MDPNGADLVDVNTPCLLVGAAGDDDDDEEEDDEDTMVNASFVNVLFLVASRDE